MAHYRYIRLVVISVCLLTVAFFLTRTQPDLPEVPPVFDLSPEYIRKYHPLDDVIRKAQETQAKTIQSETNTLHESADSYRRRRGRHPPPGFEKWFERALNSRAVIVESFFDQIYEDLEPFWGMRPGEIRNSLDDWKWTLRIRNGKIKNIPQGRFRSRVWGSMIQQVAPELPDMDIAINPLDEPRVFAPWEDINELMKKASQQREHVNAQPLDTMLNKHSRLAVKHESKSIKHKWITKGKLWPHILDTCPPWKQEAAVQQGGLEPTTNWTTGKDICSNHQWANIHGSLIKPATMSISTNLIPIFSATKLQGSNDILLPPPSYFTDDALFTGKDWWGDGKTSIPWHKKSHGLVWRGKATGGEVHKAAWENSHRQRLVSMLNASETSLRFHESAYQYPSIDGAKNPEQRDEHALSSWLSSVANAGFTDLLCSLKDSKKPCKPLSNHYKPVPSIPMKKQYAWKYLPDIDGNSLSGRFRAFLLSNSSPMKATIFKEWHDSRLMPWEHFIPLDISLRDLWSTMAYFLGFEGGDAHDEKGERIATEGRLWADKVLRKEDMLLYVHRVLIEYARLCDDERDRLGYTDDLR
ncbi:hypothetical protein Q7P37_008662 [Cladosporium fusiforme]